jgi:hypothetical protein
MSAEQLEIRPSADRGPVWATDGHTAGELVSWLCDVIDEPGAETTPFTDAATPAGKTISTIRAGGRRLRVPQLSAIQALCQGLELDVESGCTRTNG